MSLSPSSTPSSKSLNFDFDDQVLPNNIITYLSTILLDCIQYIEILNQRTYKPVNLDKWKYKLLCQRFTTPKKFTLEDEIGAGDAIYYENMKRIHYVSDFFCTILQETRCEMNDYCQFSILKNLVADLDVTKEDECILLQDKQEEEDNKILHAELDIIGDKIKNIVNNKFFLIKNLISEYEQVQFECELKENYVLNWENSRKEQCLLKEKIFKNNLEKQINETKENINVELNTHISITNYIWINITDMKSQIEIWKIKFDLDHEQIRNQILSLKDKRDDIQELLVKMKEEYQSRNEQIQEYLMLKARRQEEEERKLEANKTLYKSKKSGRKCRTKA